MNCFVFAGKNSLDFGAVLLGSNMYDGAEMDISSTEIPGRNGNLHIFNNRWKNFKLDVTAAILKEKDAHVTSLRRFLSSKIGYYRYEESTNPEEYRMARFSGGFALKTSDRYGARVKLAFDCKPQRYLKLGEAETNVASGAVLYNPTEYNALPLLRVYGTGTVGIGSYSFAVTSADGYTDIDCETMEAYKGSTNCNNSVVISSFPELEPGENLITFTGVTQLIVKPRWWTI